MKIVLVSRIDEADALCYTASLARELEDLGGHDVTFEKGTAEHLGEEGVPFEEIGGDLVVVVGGDGSVLLTVHQMKKQVPVLGINWGGEVGFLADLEPDEAGAFFATHTDGFRVESRMRVSLSVNGQLLGDALNEGARRHRPSGEDAQVRRLRRRNARGAVPGRRSARIDPPDRFDRLRHERGRPIVDPQIEGGFLLVPLAPYMLSSRPHLISTQRTLEITLETEKPAHLVIDGQSTFELAKESTLTVKKSDQPALFVHTGKPFFEKVNHKLRNL